MRSREFSGAQILRSERELAQISLNVLRDYAAMSKILRCAASVVGLPTLSRH